MTDGYSAEQAADGTGMDADLIPWMERAWSVDLIHPEFPYFEYAGPEDSPEVKRWMDSYGCSDIWTLPDRLRESAAYRTDVVGVRIDYRQVDRRRRALGHLETLIQGEGWGAEQPNLRTYLNFRRDGPMTEDYYQRAHGLHGEPNAMDANDSARTFRWLAKHGFLTEHPGGEGWKAVDLTLAFGAVHAVELKREPSAWDTALEQASRASVYADFRHVCFSERTVDRALANSDVFRDAGVGLLSVSSATGAVTVHVDAARCTPTEDHALLSRPYCERWDLNERVLSRAALGD